MTGTIKLYLILGGAAALAGGAWYFNHLIEQTAIQEQVIEDMRTAMKSMVDERTLRDEVMTELAEKTDKLDRDNKTLKRRLRDVSNEDGCLDRPTGDDLNRLFMDADTVGRLR